MKLDYYTEQCKRLPAIGKQVIGHREGDSLTVYQAFNPAIADYAVSNQKFGGSHYSFNRMSWIKPGFLWMMYRAGWASKEHQQCILAISLPLVHFENILRQATISSYDAGIYTSHDAWKHELESTEVRLQWDPDHDPYGNKQERKAIQIGMKGETLRRFCTEWISSIEDITPFVHEQYRHVQAHDLDQLRLPYEEVIPVEDAVINQRLGL